MSISRRKFIINAGILTGTLVLADSFWFEKYFIETNEFYLGDASKETENIKLVQLSDLHLQSIGGMHKTLCKKINKLNPDLIFFTGDVVDKKENISLVKDFLQLLNPDIQKAAITGNWEYWGNVDLTALRKLYKESNCDFLINQGKQYFIKNKTIAVSGLDDYIGGKADFELTMKDYVKSDFHIVLNHCPGYRDVMLPQLKEDIKVDLILSGHTHGGQITIFGFIPFKPPGSGNYLKGWYDTYPRTYVSKGIGTSVIPARFGARAEVGVFHLKA
ncbi:MAG: metallophosphoesterase [Cytophagaceae bacterium]